MESHGTLSPSQQGCGDGKERVWADLLRRGLWKWWEDITVEKTVGICIIVAIWEAIFFQNLASKKLFREYHHI